MKNVLKQGFNYKKNIDHESHCDPEKKARVLHDFATKNHISDTQKEQFASYADLILEWGEKFNLTAKKSFQNILKDLFTDSLEILNVVDFSKMTSFADIGTGAGIPGICLSIINPELKCYLIEVNHKKVEFLRYVAKTLGLNNVEIISLDFRTFCRTTNLNVDLFVTKAALHDDELIRVFRETSFYKNSAVIYWTTQEWIPCLKSESFFQGRHNYLNEKKLNSLAVFCKIGFENFSFIKDGSFSLQSV